MTQHIAEDKYHGLIRIIHWIMAVAFAIIFSIGFFMVDYKECEPWGLYELHKSLGVLVLILVVIRLVIRWLTTQPTLPSEFPAITRFVAHAVANLMYLFMFIVPISGYALSNIHGYAVKFFSIPLPMLFPKVEEWEVLIKMVHFYSAYIFLALIALHILGVIVHHAQKQDILHRMT